MKNDFDDRSGMLAAATAGAQPEPVLAPRAWLGTAQFAALAGIAAQAARRALRRSLLGHAWRGHRIDVRQRYGRGGRSGLVYEVAVESLPDSLRCDGTGSSAHEIDAGGAIVRRRTASKQSAAISERWSAIRDAEAHPARSAERASAIAIAAAASGRSERTLYRWIKLHEAHGLQGLGRARAANAGVPRVMVSRDFDRAVRAAGYAEIVLRELARCVETSLKGLWASRAEQAGCGEIRRLAEFMLLEACQARNVAIDRGAIRLSRRCVERFAHYRVVNQRENDRKAFDDGKPRIRRDWTALQPMERVVADVKHLDVLVRRADGSLAWPKIVGFMDAGVGRIFIHPVLLDAGEGVRQEHVIEGFLAMVADPSWGFPRGLYLDNGSEFAALLKIQAALNAINDPQARTVIFAKPYNAAAKPIESLFARLDRYVFSMLPGYAGPNRLAKKTQAVGKAPEPFPGAWEEFCATIQGLVSAYHQQSVGGQWAGRSPNAWFEAKVAAGWRASLVDLVSLDGAFCNHDSRRLDRGVVKVRGERYTHPEISRLSTRTVVDLAMPWRRDVTPLARVPGAGWVRLTREISYPAQWIAGARESSCRQKAQSRYVSGLAKDAVAIDPIATKLRWARSQPQMDPHPPGQELDLGGQLKDLGAALGPKTAATPSRADLRRAREMALTERLEREQRRDD